MSSPAGGIEIRPMTASDLPQVLEIAASLPGAPQWPSSAYRNALEPESAPRRIALAAIDAAGKISGFVVASLLAGQAELETIAVAAVSQRQGIARGLLGFLIDALRQAGIREVFLEVRTSNAPAIALYRRFGFQETGRRPRYYADPIEEALLMKLALA